MAADDDLEETQERIRRCGPLSDCARNGHTDRLGDEPIEEHVSYWVHRDCDGLVIWDLSGGFCIRCHAEDLTEEDAEKSGAKTP